MFPSTVERVPRSTASRVNQDIRRKTMNNIARYAAAGPAAIERRLVALDREWDIERVLEANFGSVVGISVLLGFLVNPLWYAVAGAAGGFLLIHGLLGWCPPLPIYRRLGVRTAYEIASERYALKALRGDFRDVPAREEAVGDPALLERVVQAVRRGGDRPPWKMLRD